MSSTESSGAPAEATATTPAPDAAFPTFGSTRGSGLARGKGKRASAPAAATAASTAYTPTAIEVVTSPREYTNPFAPAPEQTPAPVTEVAPSAVGLAKADPAPVAPAPARAEPVERIAPVKQYSAPVEQAPAEAAPAHFESAEPAELNILEPEQQKHSPAQTWESEGFRPARAERSERPRREESRRDEPRREERSERPAEPFDPASIPEKFLYVRPGHTYVPTPTNFGGAPRERNSAPREAYSAAMPSASSSAPAAEKSGGFLGWLKGLFGGSSAAAPAPVAAGSHNGEDRREGGEYRRHRGGRNRGGQGGGQGRGRGGRGRSGGGSGGYRSEGSSQGGV